MRGGELKEACAADLTGQKAAFQELFDGGPLSSEELFPWQCTLFERDRGSASFPAQGEEPVRFSLFSATLKRAGSFAARFH